VLVYQEIGLRAPNAFAIDLEYTLPAFAAVILLLLAAALTAILANALGGRDKLILLALAGLLVASGFDDILELHDRAENATGIDWRILALPVVAVAFVCLARTLQMLWELVSVRMLIAGAIAAWVGAQVLDFLAQSETSAAPAARITEEVLEMTGSGLFALAMLVAIQAIGKAPSPSTRGSASLRVAAPSIKRGVTRDSVPSAETSRASLT
jgi:hypothetical protein